MNIEYKENSFLKKLEEKSGYKLNLNFDEGKKPFFMVSSEGKDLFKFYHDDLIYMIGTFILSFNKTNDEVINEIGEFLTTHQK